MSVRPDAPLRIVTRALTNLDDLRDLDRGGIEVWLGKFEWQLTEMVDQDLRHREVAKPFVVRGNQIPRGVFRGAA